MTLDLRDKDNPIHVCVCGSRLWNLKAMFEDYEVSFYFLDMECAECGALATAPTLVDMPEGYMGSNYREEYIDEEDNG